MDNVSYRTDECLQEILRNAGDVAPIGVSETFQWFSENRKGIEARLPDIAQRQRLKKLIAGFEVSAIR